MKRISHKRTLMPVLLGVFLLSGCEAPTIEPAAGSSEVVEGKAFVLREENGVTIVKQIDETLPLDGISFEVDGLDEEFSLRLGDLKAKGVDKPLITSVYSLFLADVNNDGHHDFIYTTGARLRKEAGTWIGIYDYHNGKELYRLDDPRVFDYDLRFEGGKFIVSQFNTDYYDSKNVLKLNRLVGKGILDYSNPTITVEWQNFLKADSFNISVTTADSSRTPITMKAGQRENTFVVEHAVADKAYCITTNLVRNNGNYDDLLTDLPVGYFADCRLVQAVANNHQDNVIVSFEGAIQGMEEGTYFVEACVSGYEFEIYFDFDTLESHPSDMPTLMQTMGWSFNKDELIEYSREYIPGGDFNAYGEEAYPFMYVSVAKEGEATKTSFNLLEGRVVPIDPALISGIYQASHHKFKTSSQTYTLNEYGPFFEHGTSFYLVSSCKDYSYATSNSDGYKRLRDGHTEINVTPLGENLEPKVLQNANKILFKETNLDQKNRLKLLESGQYRFNIAGNDFYIIDSKTMVVVNPEWAAKCEAVSTYDFSSLFAK